MIPYNFEVYIKYISKTETICSDFITDVYMSTSTLYTKLYKDYITNMDSMAIINVNRGCVYMRATFYS